MNNCLKSRFEFEYFSDLNLLDSFGLQNTPVFLFEFSKYYKKVLFINKHFQGLFIGILGPDMQIGQTSFVYKHAIRVDFICFVGLLVVKRMIEEHVFEKVRNEVPDSFQRCVRT